MTLSDEIDALLPIRTRAGASALVELMDRLPHDDGVNGLWPNWGADVIEAAADGWHPHEINVAARALIEELDDREAMPA